jgi:hypothetical protein
MTTPTPRRGPSPPLLTNRSRRTLQAHILARRPFNTIDLYTLDAPHTYSVLAKVDRWPLFSVVDLPDEPPRWFINATFIPSNHVQYMLRNLLPPEANEHTQTALNVREMDILIQEGYVKFVAVKLRGLF